MLAYLLDEQISRVVAEQVRAKRPEIPVESVYRWRGGALLSMADTAILNAAREEGLTLVTYDVSTIAPVAVERAQSRLNHAGVVFIDHRTIASSNFGGLVRALIAHWDRCYADEWTNRIDFLRPFP